MKLSTKGRYAMIALTDLAAQGPDRLVSLERDRRAAGHQPRLSRAALRQAPPGGDRRSRCAAPAAATGWRGRSRRSASPRSWRRWTRRWTRWRAAPGRTGGAGGTREQKLADKLWEQLSANVYVMLHQTRLGDVVDEPARALPGGAGVRRGGGRGGQGRSMTRAGLSRLERDRAAPARGAGGDGGGDGARRQPVVGARRGPGGAGDRRAGARRRSRRDRLRARARSSSPRGATEAAGAGASPGRGARRAAAIEHDCVAAWDASRQLAARSAHGRVAVGEPGPAACCRRRTRETGRWPQALPARAGSCVDVGAGGGHGAFAFDWSGRRTALVCRRTSSAGRRASARCCCAPGVEIEPLAARAAGRSSGGAPAPRTWSASPGSAPRPRRRRRDLADGVWDAVAEIRNILEDALASAATIDYFCRERRAAAAEHQLLRGARLEGRDAGDADGPGGLRRLRRVGLLERQGAGQPGAGGDGARPGGRRRARSGSRSGRRRRATRCWPSPAAWERHYRRFRAPGGVSERKRTRWPHLDEIERARGRRPGDGRGGALGRRALQVRLRHRHRDRVRAEGAERGHRPADLGEERRAGVADRVAAAAPIGAGCSSRSGRPGRCSTYPDIDFQDQYYYARPKSMAVRPKSLDEVDPALLATYEKLGIPLKEQMILAGVEGAEAAPAEGAPGGGRRGVRLGVGRHDLQGGARQGRGDLLLDLRGGARASGARAEIPRQRRALQRQLLCDAELGGVLGRLVRLRAARACAARWSSRPTSASTPRTPASSSAR